MEFGFDKGPHLKDTNHTSKIMRRLFIALIPIILFAIYKNGFLPYSEGTIDLYGALRPLLMIILAVITSLLVETIYLGLILKKDDLIRNLKESYAIFPGLFMVLLLPVNTPLWVVILGSAVATLFGKMIFGGFGYNIFNPALVGVLFVLTFFSSIIISRGGYLNAIELNTIASPLSNLSNINYVGTYDELMTPFGTIWDMLFGFIPGGLGETSKILIILAFFYLIFTKVIKWIIPVSCILVVFVMTYIIGFMNDINIWYPLFHILSGGLLFGSVFMATDPVTSPTTKFGQLLFGLGLGLLTVINRFILPFPAAIVIAILMMNMLVFIIDTIGAKAKFKLSYKYLSLSLFAIAIIGFSIYLGNGFRNDNLVEANSITNLSIVCKTNVNLL
ncbi:MAG: RnfABCDGE type electron transport complex subunit D [Bacilli bacterium]|nr:RnfABCDGE type electron transport complex subunit D [Bacilli bacterium]MDD3305287.1 RnfABCDGE type electron transport complex subunit D [Bacilli bacterium]MDD4053577.1 RnfABCDGE type electron transport complex subunit D [Bacilli bacterium]MDD4411456.1 RnfABCDGE type electron transport complex subunit D [Bacilli bacterium]